MPNGIDLAQEFLRSGVLNSGGGVLPPRDIGQTCCRRYLMCSSYKLMGLYYRQHSARSRLVSPATSNASYAYCLRYWETQLGKTTLNSIETVVAKKTDSSAFNSSNLEDFPCATELDVGLPNGLHAVAYPTGGILCVFAYKTAHHQLIFCGSVSPCLSEC